MKKILLMLSMLFCIAYAKAQTVTGTIVDAETKKGIGGVLVRIGNSKVATDEQGNFNIAVVKGNYELSASFIGYETYKSNVSLPLAKPLNIALTPKTEQLEEVKVSTGYQTLPRERATGSFSLIDQKKLTEQVGSNIVNRLEGITPALSIDRRSNGGSMMIRGLSTLRSDRTPLIVLDNFPYEGNLDNLNPADVENISILKDAAVASIWGARAGNGVIVITTKKGRYNERTSFSAGAGFNALSIPDASYNRNISAADLIATEQMLFSRGYYISQENAVAQPALSTAVELMIAARKGLISNQALQEGLALLAQQDIMVNYSNAFYKTGLNHQYYLNGHGGSASMNWKVFAGFDDNRSVLEAGYQRYNLKFDQNWQPLKKLEVGLSLAFTQAQTTSGRAALNSFTTATGNLPTYTRFYDEAGNPLALMQNYSSRYLATAGNGRLLNWEYYPLADSEFGQSKSGSSDVVGNFRASYEVLRGLKASFNYFYERQMVRGKSLYSEESFLTRNLINSFTQISGTTLSRPIPLGAINDANEQVLQVHNLRGQLSYDKTFGKLSLNALGGVEQREARNDSNTKRLYGFDEETLASVGVDYANFYRNFVLGSNGFIPNRDGFSGTNNRFVSVFASGALSYKGRYTISASARRDGSNLFGVTTNQKWRPLWSAGFAWQISEENFAKEWPNLRLRMTYGSSGNANSRFAAVTTISYDASSPYTQTPSAGFTNFANPQLRWERVNTLNLAVDFRVLNNRLSGSVDYYIKKADDLIGTAPIDYTTGIGFQVTKNTARIGARGLDLELNSKNLTGAIKWNSDFFANFYKDRVDEYYLASAPASNFVNGDAVVNGIVGMPVYAAYGYKWAGLNPLNGNPRGYLNGALSEDYNTITGSSASINDLDYMGRAFPTLTGALGNQLEWNGFNLNFRIGYKFGYYFRRSSLSYSTLYANRMGDVEYGSRWQNPGDELLTNVPSQVYPAVGARDNFYNYSTATIISGDHIRLQSICLGYVFDKIRYAYLPFQNISLLFQANNLGLIWLANKENIDPDFPVTKPFKTFSLSMKVNF